MDIRQLGLKPNKPLAISMISDLLKRSRREYEHDEVAYRRVDRIIAAENGKFLLRTREVEVLQRVFVGKNLALFL